MDRRKRFAGVLLFAALAAVPSQARDLPTDLQTAAPEDVGLSSERLERLSGTMREYVDGGRLAGTITMVARHGKVVHFQPVGMMDVEQGREMRPDTIFRIYSMTKPVTGVAVMMLFEEGRFLLTDPISKYLPEMDGLQVFVGGTAQQPETEPAVPITIEHLLTHTSGLLYDDPGPGVAEIYRDAGIWQAPSLAAFTKKIAGLPLVAQPGTQWHYSVSMDVLGRLVEVVSGRPFDRFLEERIFEPLAMPDTAFYVPEEKAHRLAAHYKATDEGGIERVKAGESDRLLDSSGVPYGGGGLVSTAGDFMRFAQMVLNGGELDGVRILGRKTVDLMMGNHLGPEYGPAPLAGFEPWLQSSASGVGFGYTGAVITDPALTSVPGSVGSFFWGGAASTYFWIDREEELIGILMTQLRPSATYPLRALVRILTYQALTD